MNHTKGRKNFFRNERGKDGRTRVMFIQTIERDNQGKCSSAPGRNSSQGDPVTGKYGNLYRHTECYARYSYGNFADQ